MTTLRLRAFSSISNIVGYTLRILALCLLPKPSQQIYERTQTILKSCGTDLNWELYANALIQAEDHRFYFHQGVDCIAITRALYQTLVHRCRQGGSTIEQQLVRTITGDYRRNYSRKVREMLLASTLSRVLSKQEVLRVYLSVAYFGTGIVGLSEAIEKISIPAVMNGCTEAYLIAHLRYPKLRRGKDNLSRLRLKRAEVISRYCEWTPYISLLLTRYSSHQLLLSSISYSSSNHKI